MLTDAQCRNAICPTEKKHARFTEFGGMYLQVSPAVSKRWFLKCRISGKEKQLVLGSYPAMSLTAARKARDMAKLQKAAGSDPVQARKIEKLKSTRPDGDTFKAVALEWYGKQWSMSTILTARRQLSWPVEAGNEFDCLCGRASLSHRRGMPRLCGAAAVALHIHLQNG